MSNELEFAMGMIAVRYALEEFGAFSESMLEEIAEGVLETKESCTMFKERAPEYVDLISNFERLTSLLMQVSMKSSQMRGVSSELLALGEEENVNYSYWLSRFQLFKDKNDEILAIQEEVGQLREAISEDLKAF